MSKETGTTWPEVYEVAAQALWKTAAFAGPDAIKRSYLLVRKQMNDEAHAFKYYMVSLKTLARLGLKGL